MSNHHTTGFIFGVVYTEDGTRDSKHLGYRVVLTAFDNDEERVIVHNEIDGNRADVSRLLNGSLTWATGKYPLYVVDKTRVRKGPMPPHPDKVNKKTGKMRVVLELAIEYDPSIIDLCDVEDVMHKVLVESDSVRRATVDVQGLTGPR